MSTARNRLLRRERGISLIELMIGITLGLLLLTALASLYFANSVSRAEFVKSSEQIENGRYALDLIRRDAELAGFFGSGGIAKGAKPTQPQPAPCETSPAALGFAASPSVTLPLAVTGYAPGVIAPCLPDLAATSEVVVMRRVSTTTVAAAATGVPYMQVSACPDDGATFVFDASAVAFNLRTKACDPTVPAPLRPAVVRIFYLSPCDLCTNGGDGIPTLKMAELVNGVFQIRSLTQGIQDMHVLYGVDLDNNGSADCYVADPGANNSAACTAVPGYDWSTALDNWANVTTLRVSVLARTLQLSAGQVDNRTYDLGRATASGPFNDGYKRHVYSAVARLVNVAGLREQ
ncbi:PilW family protein [Cupriavidus sp. IDO]|uniref:PilW family protein n=1 Tax=Cupriavidus sp. IDO TaxID=1539142 RepID=UPI000579544D|nr:PilW family protein [Cupriavidus sp. IDO]KWR89998.1 pilus assembly protein PilW [Cupriavidus sp. IDO]